MQTIIGVIGGVGPYAGLDFVQKIFANTNAKKDQDHLNCILASLPAAVADRTAFLLKGDGENPAKGLFESARRLHAAGAEYAAVACNTAHAGLIFGPFCDMVRESLPGLTVINMLETCAAHVKKETPEIRRLGLLATVGTHKSAVYREYFSGEYGFELLEPDEAGQAQVHEAIYNEGFGIKSFSQPVTEAARGIIKDAINSLVERGAQAVILGCTELPLAASPCGFSVPLVDPGFVTARRLIELAAPLKLVR